MGVVTKAELQKLLALPGYRIDSLVISPLLDFDMQLDEDSVDIRLGNYFIIAKHIKMDCIRIEKVKPEMQQTKPEEVQQMVYIPFGKEIKIPPHGSVLGCSLEYIKLPFNISAQVLTKSSWGRYFLTIATATWVHPGYRGCLTFELLNSSNTPIALIPAMKVAQLIFFKNELEKIPSKDIVKGAYQGAVYPEYPKFPEDINIPESIEKGKNF